jgi:erythromycin esterase-like protein
MWPNADVLNFVGWMRSRHDDGQRAIGLCVLDLYSLYRSIEAVVAYLDRIDPAAAQRARERSACLERFDESQRLRSGQGQTCEDEHRGRDQPDGRARSQPRQRAEAVGTHDLLVGGECPD